MNSLPQTLGKYIAACFSGIWIETFEPDEAIREIELLCRDENWKHVIWDIEQGLQQDGNVQSMDPLTVVQSLGSLANGETPQLILLRNFHRFLGSIDILQALERQIAQGKIRRAFVVILAPVVQIPVELEKLFVVVEHPLPDKEQLRQIATEIAGELPDEPNTRRVLEAASGMTRLEAEGAFSLLLITEETLLPEPIWQLKANMLRQSSARGEIPTLGGLGNLMTFCNRALSTNGQNEKAKGVMLLGISGSGKSAFAKRLGYSVHRPTLVPVHRNVIEQPMFNLIPLARARRKMTHMNRQSTFVRKFLQAIFPEAIAASVAPAAVRRDAQMFCVRINILAQVVVPPSNRLHRELGGVMVDSDVDPTKILLQVVNSVRRRLAEEACRFTAVAFGLEMPPPVGRLPDTSAQRKRVDATAWKRHPPAWQRPDQFLLFRIDGNDRTIPFQKRFRLFVDEFELSVAIRICSAFNRFAIPGKLVFQFVQQLTNFHVRKGKTIFVQYFAQASRAFCRPTEWRHRIALGGRLDEGVEGRQQFRLTFRRAFSSGSFASYTFFDKSFFISKFVDALGNGRPRHSGRFRDGCDPAMSQAHRFTRGPKPSLSFVQFIFQHEKLVCNDFFHECVSLGKIIAYLRAFVLVIYLQILRNVKILVFNIKRKEFTNPINRQVLYQDAVNTVPFWGQAAGQVFVESYLSDGRGKSGLTTGSGFGFLAEKRMSQRSQKAIAEIECRRCVDFECGGSEQIFFHPVENPTVCFGLLFDRNFPL